MSGLLRPKASTLGLLDICRSRDAELGPGVKESLRGVGVMDFETGVVAFSFRPGSLDLVGGVLREEASDAGLLGASLRSRWNLSSPFPRGEWDGLPCGDDGSSFETSTTKLSSLLSPSLSESLSSHFLFLPSVV